MTSDLKHQQQQTWAVVASVSFYMVTSITMVLANKWVLAALPDYPLTFLWLQILVAVLLLFLAHSTGWLKVSNDHHTAYLPVSNPGTTTTTDATVSDQKSDELKLKPTQWPAVRLEIAKKLWSLILINVVGLSVNTFCLKHIDASLYQVARSLILPFTLFLEFIVLQRRTTLPVFLSCAVVTLGFVIGLFGDSQSENTDANVSMLGVFFGVASSMTTAVHAIVIKKSLAVVDGNALELAWYNNVLSAVGLIPLILVSGEVSGMSNAQTLISPENRSRLVWGVLVTGVFGFLINIAGFLQIKVTSPVTHMISSAVRGVLQTFLAVYLFNELLTVSRASGILFILIGSTAYTYYKSNTPK